MLKGQSSKYTNYLEDKNKDRYYTNRDKCNIMEKTWSDIFRITEEEEAKFDALHSDHIESYINIQYTRKVLSPRRRRQFFSR